VGEANRSAGSTAPDIVLGRELGTTEVIDKGI